MVLYYNKDDYATPLNKSYQCDREEKLNLTNSIESMSVVAVATISNVRFEAFRKDNTGEFSLAQRCQDIPETVSSSTVAIAIVCTLIGVIAIVLIGYVVTRRNSQCRNYFSK